MTLTNAQLQARIESLENMMRVIVNQDPTRIQPVGATAQDGYVAANGTVAASNHVHGTPGPVMAAEFNGSISYGAVVSAVVQADIAYGDYLQGFAFCPNETVAASITVTDSQGNSYSVLSPIGIVGSEISPVETGSSSTWVVPFGADITAPLTVANADHVDVNYGELIGNQEVIIIQMPGCGSSGPIAPTSATGTGTSTVSGYTATLPQPRCFAVGLIASYFGSGAGVAWGPGWSAPGYMIATGSMTCWAEAVNSTYAVQASGDLIGGTPAGWAAIVIPFAIPA
jgi:hypothetical protein